jgi:hypothetical protein
MKLCNPSNNLQPCVQLCVHLARANESPARIPVWSLQNSTKLNGTERTRSNKL